MGRQHNRTQWRHNSLITLAVTGLLLLTAAAVHAIDEEEVDFAVLDDLNRLEFYDLSLILIEQMETKYPRRIDRIRIEKARTYYASGKSKQGDAVLDQVDSSSPAYGTALLLKGEVAALRGRNEEAATAYDAFFKMAKRPSPDNAKAVELYTRAVTIYSTVLKRMGEGQKAAKILELLNDMEGASDRKLAFLKAQAVLDAEDQKLTETKTLDRKAVQNALDRLSTLQYLRDGVAASAYLEMARAHILLAGAELNRLRQENKADEAVQIDGFKEALKTIKMADEAELLRDIEKQVISEGDKSDSPYAGALYYKGEAYRGLAIAFYLAGDKHKARRVMAAAAKLFETVVADYGESPYRSKALNEHGKCSAFLEQIFDEKIELADVNVEAEMQLKLEQAQAFLKEENYAGAIPIYVEAIRLGRRSKRLPAVANRLVICYAHQGRFLEAETVGSYLFDLLPSAEGTAECLFRIGAVLYEEAKKETGAEKTALLTRAMENWELFVQSAPDHVRAPQVAFAIAEHYYQLAADIAERADKATDSARKEALNQEARQAYLQAVPKYQRLVSEYAAREKGIRGLYKLGWIFYATEQPKQSIDAFLRYSESENAEKYQNDRLEAKFRAAEQMMRGENPDEAVEQFQELIAWTNPENPHGFNPKSDAATRIREDATSLLAWSYDLAGETLRPDLVELQTRLTQAQDARETAAEQAQEANHSLEQLQKKREAANQQYAELEEVLGKITLDFAQAALAEAEKRGENTAGKSAEEKAIIQRNIETEAARLAKDMEERARIRLQGEKASWEEEREQVKDALAAQQQTLENAQAAVDRAAKVFEEAEKRHATVLAELKDIQNTVADIDKRIVEGEAKARQLEEAIQQARDAYTEAKKADDLQKYRELGKDLLEQLEACRADTAEAYDKRGKLQKDEVTQQIQKLEEQLPDLETAVDQARRSLQDVERRQTVLTLDRKILEARLRALAEALDANELIAKALGKESQEQRRALQPEVAEEARQALSRFNEVKNLQMQRLDTLKNHAEETIAEAEKRIALTDKQVAELKENLKPVREAFENWKRQAEKAFSQFLAAYPNSDHVPRNLSRLGTIYLELEEFDRAAGTLDKLASDYPDAEATKEALFNLGRAQTEQGNAEAAAKTFTQLLEQTTSLNPANLTYISERMLELNQVKASLAASRILIARSADKQDPEYERLHTKAREPSLYRAGQAALAMEEYDDALTWFETLLEENPRTGFYFDVKFATAQAKRQMAPPDMQGAIADLGDIVRFTDDPVQANRALVRVGEALAAMNKEPQLRQAVARFQQVVMLADPAVPENRPWIETAIVESAKAFARLGNDQEAERMVALYSEQFPTGQHAAELVKLPEQQFKKAQNDAAGVAEAAAD